MKDIVLITGANGTVAKRLSSILEKKYAIRFLTRTKRNENDFEWHIEKQFIEKGAFENVKHIIHLAGAGIADSKWSASRKEVIKSSRVDSAKLILNTLRKNNIKISSFISASAVGYYGTETSKKIVTEDSSIGNDFLSTVCNAWEKIANQFTVEGISDRTVILRMGIVLSKNGGALKKMTKPIRFYIGSPLGTGKQYMPWIHVIDLCEIIKYTIVSSKIKGVYNAVAPEHITNSDFTKMIAKTIKKPIIFPNIPTFVITLLFGEMASILLKGNSVSSEKIIREGYVFKFPNIKDALDDLLIRK